MKNKKWIAGLLALTMAASALPSVDGMLTIHSRAEASVQSELYFYQQFDQEKEGDYQKFYHAMEKMAEGGADSCFAKGNDYDLVVNDIFTSKDVEKFADGGGNVLNIYGAARDAFTADHPELFYVDFSALSVRIKKVDNEYHLYLGAGRRSNYWTESFTSADEVKQAITTYDNAFNEAYSSLTGEGKDFITAAHDYITKNTSYRLENKFSQDDTNQYLIRTAYGSLVNHKAVCEGYARLFKAFMDEKGIPCVLVQGAYRPDAESYELHMWTYVELDGKWYAVDPTIDDPTNSKKGLNDVGVDGYENHEYLLKGENKMAVKYAPSGIRSESNYEFTYPELNYDNYGSEVVLNSNGLMIHYEQSELEGEKSGKFTISYKGMGLYEAEKQGYYFMYDSLTDRSGTITSKSFSAGKNEPGYEEKVAKAEIGDYGWTGMVYMGANADMDQGGKGNPADWICPYFKTDAEAIEAGRQAFYTTDEHLVLELPQVPYVKFAVTRIPMQTYSSEAFEDTVYYGTSSDYAATSDAIYNANGFYKAPPYPKEVTPSLQSALLIDDGAQTINAKFDQYLFMDSDYVTGNGNKISLRMNIQDMHNLSNRSGFDNSCVDNFRLVFEDGSVSSPVNAELQLITKDDEAKVTVHDVKAINNTEESFDLATVLENAGDKSVIGYQFDFTPSIMYADDNIFYEFDVKGLRGKDVSTTVAAKDSSTKQDEVYTVSGKEPIAISFLAAHRCAAHAFQSQGYDWNVFGKPTLMDDLSGFDFSKATLNGDTSDMTDGFADLNEALKDLTHRMVLVATDANPEQKEDMLEMMGDEPDVKKMGNAADFENAEYYNINLTLCKSQIVSTGQAVRVTLGFPAGYGPDDAGKTFKVYHFSKDEKGNITGVNEIPCEITEYGLVVWCDSFSPFAIVPVDIDEIPDAELREEIEAENEKRTIILPSVTNGTISAEKEESQISADNKESKTMSGTVTLYKGEKAEITIEPKKGFVIDTVTIGGVSYEIDDNDRNGTVIELPYDDINEHEASIVEATFMAESVYEVEKKENAEVIKPSISTHHFNLENGKCMDKTANGDLCGVKKDGISSFEMANIGLDGNILLNVYLDLDNSVVSDKNTYVEFNLPGEAGENHLQEVKISEQNKVTISEGNTERILYKFTAQIPAKDIHSEITFRVHSSDKVGTRYHYAVADYADSILKKADDENTGSQDAEKFVKAKDVVTEMLNYGEAAKQFFKEGGKVDDLSDDKQVKVEALNDYKPEASGEDTLEGNVSYIGSSLILDSDTYIRHYFKTDAETAKSFGLTESKSNEGFYYRQSDGIKADDLGVPVSEMIGDYTISYSPMSYVYTVMNDATADQNLKNLVSNLYNYYIAAKAYASK